MYRAAPCLTSLLRVAHIRYAAICRTTPRPSKTGASSCRATADAGATGLWAPRTRWPRLSELASLLEFVKLHIIRSDVVADRPYGSTAADLHAADQHN